MKLLPIATLVSFALTGCLDTSQVNSSATSSQVTPLSHRQILADMGFAQEDITENDSAFIVEGDILFSKESLDKYALPNSEALQKGTQIRQRRGSLWWKYWYYFTLSNNREQDLKYCLQIDDKVIQKGWKTIVERETEIAIARWNQAASDAHLRLLRSPTEGCDTPIRVHWVDQPNGEWLGIAQAPDGTPSPFIDINIDPVNYINANVYADVVAHEIGHTLGMGHAKPSSEDGYVSGTEYGDPFSIMVHYSTCNPWKEGDPGSPDELCIFAPSPGDYQTLNILYPRDNTSRQVFFRNEAYGYLEKIKIHANGLNIYRWYDSTSDIISLAWQTQATNWKPWSGYLIESPRDFIPGRYYPRNANNNSGTLGYGFVHVVRNTNFVNLWQIQNTGRYTVRQFKPGSGIAVGNGTQYVAGDFDGDGYTDLVQLLGNSYNIWLNNKNGTFTIKNHLPWSGYAVSLDNKQYIVKDVNGDGKDDIVHVYPIENVWYGSAFLNLANKGFAVQHNENL